MSPRWTQTRSLVLTLSACIAAGCGDSSLTTPSAANELTADIGITIRDEVEATVNALTLSTSVTPIGTSMTSPSTAPCVVSSTPGDSDGDGVPDDATYLMTAPPCRFAGWRGGTLELVGQLRIQDPLPTSAGFGYDETITELRARYISAAAEPEIYDVTRSGGRTLSGSTTGLLLTSDIELKRSFVGKIDARVSHKWNVNYTPSIPLQINGPVNSGTLDIAGTMTWNRANEQLELIVTTPVPLEYDAGCSDTVQRIRNGELRAAGTFGDMEGFVSIRWFECGKEPSFVFDTE
jgi:hypothetical protein